MKEKIRYGGRTNLAGAKWETTPDGDDQAVVEVVSSSPKNTMITVRDKERTFFGISRCNKKDTFSKKRGKEIARLRLNAALAEFKHEENCDGQSLLYGVTTNFGELLDYFYDIDYVHSSLENNTSDEELTTTSTSDEVDEDSLPDENVFFTNNLA